MRELWSGRQRPITPGFRCSALTLAALLATYPRLASAATTDTYIGPDNGLWSNPAYWSPGIPNSNAFDALINNPSPLTVQLDANQTINNLSLNAPDTLSLLSTLTLSGSSLLNTGTLLFNATASAPTLRITTSTNLSGRGTILMTSTASKITGTAGMRLTTDNLISGSGNIGNGLLKITNFGTITAASGTLTVAPLNATDGFINSGLLIADGGTLVLQPAIYVNTNATIEALTGSLVSLQPGGTVTGGAIAGLGGTVSLAGFLQNLSLSGTTAVNVNSASFGGSVSNAGFLSGTGTFNASTTSFYNSGTIILGGANATNSTINNSGLMTINGGAAFTNSTLNNTGTLTLLGTLTVSGSGASLAGGGTLCMNSANALITNAGGGTRLASSTTIQGFGSIQGYATANTSNSGTIIASGGALTVQYLTNSGTLRADGGTLLLSGAIFNLPVQGAGGIAESVNSSPITITGTVNGGTIRANGNSTMTLSGTAPPSINNALLTSIGGTLALVGNGWLQNSTLSGTITMTNAFLGTDILQGTITNNGVWTIRNSTSYPVFPLVYSGNGTLINNGTLNFDLAALSGPGTITQSDSFPILNNGLLAIGIGSSNPSISGFGSLNSTASLFSNSGTLAITQGVLALDAPFTFQSLVFSPSSSSSAPALYLNSNVSVSSLSIGTLAATNSGVFVNSPLTLAHDTTIYHVGLGSTLTLTSNIISGPANFLAAGGNWYAGTLASPTEILPSGNPPSQLPGIPGWQIETPGNNPNFIIGTAGPKIIDGVALTIDSGATLDWLSFYNSQWFNPNPAATHTISLKNGATIVNHGTFYAYIYDTSNLPNVFANADGNPNNAFYNFGTFGRHSLSGGFIGLTVTLQIPMFDSGFIDVQRNTIQFAGGFIDTSSPGQPATFNVFPGATLSLTAGTVSILSPITNVNGRLLLNASSQSVTTITGTGQVSVGTTLVSDGLLVSSLTLTGAALHTIRPNLTNAGTSKLNSLSLALNPATTFTATLDLTNNKFILQSDPTLPADKSAKFTLLQQALASGMNGGNWLGTGITSSTVAADNSAEGGGTHLTTLALFDNADLGLPTFGGQLVDSNSLLITTALIADTNLDNLIDSTDLQNWLAHAGTVSPFTESGDFNHDGMVDGTDFLLWFAAAGTSAQPTLDSLHLDYATLAAIQAAPVPEPASLLLLALATPLLLPRRRPKPQPQPQPQPQS